MYIFSGMACVNFVNFSEIVELMYLYYMYCDSYIVIFNNNNKRHISVRDI